VYQLGLGNDPVMVVGSSFPAVAFSMRVSPSGEFRHQQYSARHRALTYFFIRTKRPGDGCRTRATEGGEHGAGDLELDVGLREQPALEQLRVGGAIELLERNDDAQAATSPLTPMRPAKHVAAL